MTQFQSPQDSPLPRRPIAGATLVEFVVIAPTLLMILLGLMQYATLFHAKSNLNYATFEAARAGSVDHAKPAAIHAAFTRAMTGYYGGGTTTTELANAYAKATADLSAGALRIEILSPAKESFDDYHSPALAQRLGSTTRVIPNANLAFIKCPIDHPGCANDPASNQSGQTLLDANLLKLRVTYSIPKEKQMPLVGLFYTYALSVLNASDPDAFKKALIAKGRIPVVTHTVMRMQSPAIEAANASLPGPGNQGNPQDPGPPSPPVVTLPPCSIGDTACTPPPEPIIPPCDPAAGNCPDKPVCVSVTSAP